MAFLTESEIKLMGFKNIGENVLLSDKASYYNCKNISIGNNVRIDDFCVLSAGVGGIDIGNFVHIAAYSLLVGSGKIKIKNFAGISSRVSIYSSSDDYSGEYMTNPMIPTEYTNVQHGNVTLGKHVIIGSGTVILPNVEIEDGVAVGALSLVNKSCDSFYIYAGNPAKKIKKRKENLLELEKEFLKHIQ